jgi:hypothetical protein
MCCVQQYHPSELPMLGGMRSDRMIEVERTPGVEVLVAAAPAVSPHRLAMPGSWGNRHRSAPTTLRLKPC